MNLPYIQRFLDRMRGQNNASTELVMPSAEAKGLHVELTRLLAELYNLQTQSKADSGQSAQTVDLDGGNF